MAISNLSETQYIRTLRTGPRAAGVRNQRSDEISAEHVTIKDCFRYRSARSLARCGPNVDLQRVLPETAIPFAESCDQLGIACARAARF